MLKRWAFHSAAAEVAHTYIIYNIHRGREKIIHKDASARGTDDHQTIIANLYGGAILRIVVKRYSTL